MDPQSDVVTWTVILVIVVGLFLAFVRFLKWWREDKKPAGPVRLSELLERRQP